ncbi:hypothetical protein C5F47_03655 [Nitrosopumilus cobalaminigenes]|uniref:DUF432 domain-containing protein n=1 Tax=Nitrosopumilus cobalaminigenes TaxID=1470066 RepID=A0A7D5M0E7_9ARCH|nr:DUF432 domain-containing protein [Nitrosopumilus cobalaminigenes]QLH02715.1 hypothetical protein C5F47_03655 [Nitrosopumilus cobalaminigenes]
MSESGMDSAFSNYGVYSIDDQMDFTFPNITVKIKKIGKNVFSYTRKDSEDNLLEKIIPTSSSEITLEIAPIRSLNYPARRSEYMYLELESPIFLSKDSSAVVLVNCPIEIGVFLIHGESKESLDWFTCDPLNSRFCLYGTPESGTLCKYALSNIVESYDDSIPFFNAVMEINFKNDLNKGLTISKIVFPISENSIYYKDSKAIVDSLSAVLKKKLTLEILDVDPIPIQTEWTKSPTYERIEHVKRIDMGVD